MAQEAANPKLYAMVVMQAKAKYRIYPSPGASHWVHKRYLELGGKFIDSEEERKKKEMMERYLESRHHNISDKQFRGKKKHGDK